MHSSLQEGNKEVVISQLKFPVNLVKSPQGISHAYSQNLEESYFAMGYAHASDRLWQILFQRAMVKGRLSQWMGAPWLKQDIFFRSLNFSQHARTSLSHQSPLAQKLLHHYTLGVNEAMSNWKGPLPLEFMITGLPLEPWEASDSLSLLFLWELINASNWRCELTRGEISLEIGHKVRQLDPCFAQSFPQNFTSTSPWRFMPKFQTQDLEWLTHPFYQPRAYGFIVSSAISATDFPFLSYQESGPLFIPHSYYPFRLYTPKVSIYGLTLPGVPIILHGRNNSLSWTLHMTQADTDDIFIEKISPQNPNMYLTPSGPKPFEQHKEIFYIKDQDEPLSITLRTTRHGPVISDALMDAPQRQKTKHVLALNIFNMHLLSQHNMIDIFSRMAQSLNMDEFKQTLTQLSTGQRMFLYADVEGNIGRFISGVLPLRPNGVEQQSFPTLGWKNQFLTHQATLERLHAQINPISSRLWASRGQGAIFPGTFMGKSQQHSDATLMRLMDLFSSSSPYDLDDMKRAHGDIMSYWAQDFLPLFVRTAQNDPSFSTIEPLVSKWDGTMSGQVRDLFITWYHHFMNNIIHDDVEQLSPRMMGYYPSFMKWIMENQPLSWCDDQTTTHHQETCQEQAHNALKKTMAQHKRPSNIFINPLFLKGYHPLWGSSLKDKIYGIISEKSAPLQGGPFTIHRFSLPMTNGHLHPSQTTNTLMIFNLLNLDQSQMSLSSGSSGNDFSQFHMNLWSLWRQGQYFSMTNQPKNSPYVVRFTSPKYMKLSP